MTTTHKLTEGQRYALEIADSRTDGTSIGELPRSTRYPTREALRELGYIRREPKLSEAERAERQRAVAKAVSDARWVMAAEPSKWREALAELNRAADLEAECAAECDRITDAGRDALAQEKKA